MAVGPVSGWNRNYSLKNMTRRTIIETTTGRITREAPSTASMEVSNIRSQLPYRGEEKKGKNEEEWRANEKGNLTNSIHSTNIRGVLTPQATHTYFDNTTHAHHSHQSVGSDIWEKGYQYNEERQDTVLVHFGRSKPRNHPRTVGLNSMAIHSPPPPL